MKSRLLKTLGTAFFTLFTSALVLSAEQESLTVQGNVPLLTVINVFSPAESDKVEVVALLQKGISTEIRSFDGFIAASIHNSMDSNNVVVYAQWKDVASLQAAGMKVQQGKAPSMARAYQIGNPEYHTYQVVEVITGKAKP
ncbi:hypothetical protein KUL152_23420 [Tenacibaculum sp. KUL152]|nr:hypothetical protein KUL152_23420 [Tenacibaculum sp. KUL152]